MSKTTVTILGKSYTLKGDLDEDYMNHLAIQVDSKIRELQSQLSRMDLHQILILVALNFADEVAQLKNQTISPEDDVSQLEAKAKSLITMLEKGMIGD